MSAKKTHASLLTQAANRRRLRKTLKQMLAGGMPVELQKVISSPNAGRQIIEFPQTA